MIASIVGNYLKDVGLLSEEQLYDLLVEHRRVRAKLGIIAVADGLMTQEEAERVNRLQAIMDMRFGDIAMEEGYLTEDQVEMLLEKQGNAYMAFAQALENQRLMLIEQLEQLLVDFQYDNDFSSSDIEKLKTDDVDQIIRVFLPQDGMEYEKIASIAVRTIMRLIDADVSIGKAYFTNRKEAENGAIQKVSGRRGYTTGIVGNGRALCNMASVFAQETFNAVDADALDAVGEIVNCINGLVSAALEETDSTLDLCPAQYSDHLEAVVCDKMLVLPLRILGKKMDFIMAIENEIQMK